jgi:hypothetical protein
MLMWHRHLWLIDHGAALYFHHAGGNYRERASDPFAKISDHVLLPRADTLEATDAAMTARLGAGVLRDIVELVPATWLEADPLFAAAAERRAAYVDYLTARLAGPRAFVEEAIRARSRHV